MSVVDCPRLSSRYVENTENAASPAPPCQRGCRGFDSRSAPIHGDPPSPPESGRLLFSGPLARVRRSATAPSIVVWLSGCRRTYRTGGGSEASFPRDSPSSKVPRRRLPQSMKPEDLDTRLILDQAPALLFSGRPNGYINYVNRRWLEEIGASLEAVQGRGWHRPRDLRSGRAAKGAALALRRLSQRHGVPSSHIDRP